MSAYKNRDNKVEAAKVAAESKIVEANAFPAPIMKKKEYKPKSK